jgi:membrane protease YdiL (CAAX protease family)
MRGFFIAETNRIKALLLEERLIASVLVSSTLFLVASRYLPTSPKIFGSLFYYVALPLLVIVLVLRRDPLDFGLRAGRWRIWLLHAVVVCALSIALAAIAARLPAFREYYGSKPALTAGRVALALVNIFAVEFMFRGFMLFGLKERLGGGAVLVQMVPFALLHLHKPGLEAAGCVISGIYFGYLAWRTDSLWPVYVIHCIAALSMMVFAA